MPGLNHIDANNSLEVQFSIYNATISSRPNVYEVCQPTNSRTSLSHSKSPRSRREHFAIVLRAMSRPFYNTLGTVIPLSRNARLSLGAALTCLPSLPSSTISLSYSTTNLGSNLQLAYRSGVKLVGKSNLGRGLRERREGPQRNELDEVGALAQSGSAQTPLSLTCLRLLLHPTMSPPRGYITSSLARPSDVGVLRSCRTR